MKKPLLSMQMLCVGLTLLSAPTALAADNSPRFDTLRQTIAFKDLPGVKPQFREQPMDQVTCTSSIVESDDPFPSSRPFAGSEVIYRCTQGDTTFESDRAPFPMERRRRGLNW